MAGSFGVNMAGSNGVNGEGVAVSNSGIDLSTIMDQRIIPKPKPLEKVEQWVDFKFELRNYMSLIQRLIVKEMNKSETSRDRVDDYDFSNNEYAGVRDRSTLLYVVLSATTLGRAKQMVRHEEDTQNGYECWRALCAEFQPQGTAARLFKLRQLVKAPMLVGKTETNFSTGLRHGKRRLDSMNRCLWRLVMNR